MDRREHHRVQLRLPARLRWTTPFGQKIEVCDTVNASRGGVLVPCREPCAEGMSLWVTLPYDAVIPCAQPEILAKVVRVVGSKGLGPGSTGTGEAGGGQGGVDREKGAGNSGEVPDRSVRALDTPAVVVALRFEIAPRHRASGNGHRRESERRVSPRRQLAVPVQVRPEHVPWFEETMTVDCSAEGLRIRSNREYHPGQYLAVSFESPDTSPWPVASECVLMVARIDRMPESPALTVALCRSRQISFRF